MIKKEDWWKPAMFFYTKVTSWIILPVLIAIFTSRILIKNTNQILFLLIILISFFITCFGIYREIKIYKKEIDKNSNGNRK